MYMIHWLKSGRDTRLITRDIHYGEFTVVGGRFLQCSGTVSLIVRQPKPVLGVNLLLSGIVFFMIDYKRVRHAFSENAG